MPLHVRIGEIFLASELGDVCAAEHLAARRRAFSESLSRFLVRDTGTDREGLRVVLLVESPHVDEVIPSEIDDRYPLAGSAGIYIRRVLIGPEFTPTEQHIKEQQPMGRLVHEKDNAVQWLGIMNISELPFQKRAYKKSCHHIPQRNNDCRDDDNWNDYIECMKYIKKNPGVKTYMSPDNDKKERWQGLRCKIDQLEHAIIEDLAGRLESIGKNVRVMCLGDVAQIFYLKSLYYRDTDGYILDFPYPSSRSPWSRQYWDNLSPQNDQRLQGILDHIG